MIRRGRRLWAPEPIRLTVGGLVLGGTLALASPSAAQQRLELEEERAFVLPDSVTVSQADFVDGRPIVLWGPTDAWIIEGGRMSQLCQDKVGHVLAGRLTHSGNVELIIAGPEAGIVVRSEVRCQLSALPRIELLAATWLDERALGLDTAGTVHVLTSPSRALTVPRPVSEMHAQLARAASDTLPLWMAPTTDGYVLAMSAPPYAWIGAQLDGTELVVNPLAFESVRSLGIGASTGVAQIGAQYIQIIADLQSSARLMLLYDDEGQPVRASQVPVPFGILDVDQDSQKLLALRRTDRLEAVIYRYSEPLTHRE